MGLALYVTLKKAVPGFDASSVSGKFLARAQKGLDRIAKREGLTPLEDFIRAAPEDLLAFLEDEGGVPEGVELPPEEWFEPSEGLRTVRALLQHLRRDPSGVRHAREVCDDLEAAEAVLAAAAKRDIRFHFSVDF